MVKYKHIIEAIDNYNKTYSHKPHLDSLPYDLTTKDPKKLKERLKEIDKRIEDTEELIASEKWIQEDRQNAIDELKEENKDWQDRIDSMNEIEKDFQEINQNLKEDAKKDISELVDDLNKVLDGDKLPKDSFGTDELKYYYNDFHRLNELFEDGGVWLSSLNISFAKPFYKNLNTTENILIFNYYLI